MTDLQKYQITAAHVAAVRASGFDARDPDARHPVRNPTAEKILAARGRAPIARDPRIDALMRAKDGLVDRVLGRGLGLLLTTALTAVSALPALAAAEADGATSTLEEIAAGLGVMAAAIPGPRDPIWITTLLAGLLATRIIDITRRKSAMPRTPKTAAKPIKRQEIKPTPVRGETVDTSAASLLRWHVDGASRMGKVRNENQDAYRVVRVKENKAALILCDGAGGIEGGKLAAETASETIAACLSAALNGPDGSDWPVILDDAIAQARRAVKAEKSAGITTAIAAVLDGDRLYYATLGDGALSLIWPAEKVTREDATEEDEETAHAFMVQELLAAHHVRGAQSNVIAAFIGDDCGIPPRIGSVRCEPGCLLLAMSDGVSDLLSRPGLAVDLSHYALCLAASDDGRSLTEDLLRQLEDARDPTTGAYLHSDNMTLLMATLATAGGDRG